MEGKKMRIERLFSWGNPVIVAIDHGKFFGPVEGIINLEETLSKIWNADGILMSPFVLSSIRKFFCSFTSPAIILRVNWTASLCQLWNYKMGYTKSIMEPEEAISYGADIILANLTLKSGDERMDSENIKIFSEIARKKEKIHRYVKEVVRISWELGADMIKTYYTGEKFEEITGSVPIPVFVLGGEKMKEEKDAIELARKSISKGAKGIVYGRNIFQSENPTLFIENLRAEINGSKYTQLKMHLYNFNNLPAVKLPSGYKIRTFRKGDEKVWCRIINRCLNGNWTEKAFTERFKSKKQFDPDSLFFLVHGNETCGTVLAWREEKHIGQLHFLGVLPSHRGKNLGYSLSLVALDYFRKKGIKEVFLYTDDFRLPAIKIYLKLGFKPVILDKFHLMRWNKIFNILKNGRD